MWRSSLENARSFDIRPNSLLMKVGASWRQSSSRLVDNVAVMSVPREAWTAARDLSLSPAAAALSIIGHRLLPRARFPLPAFREERHVLWPHVPVAPAELGA